ncbi:MAG: hypothetical protein ACREAR_06960 [Nitrosotalea sp.]
MSQSSKIIEIYNYDRLFERIFAQLKNELSGNNFELMIQYDQTMVISSLGKSTAIKRIN